jgi:hypothetical protein
VLDASLTIELALQRAELADVLQVSRADGALGGADCALWRPRLGAPAEEDDLGAVDDVGLDAANVGKFGDVLDFDNVVVGATADLQEG